MDSLILNLYDKKIIKIGEYKLSNKTDVPLYFNFNELFNIANKHILKSFLNLLNEFITNYSGNLNIITLGKDHIANNICCLLSFIFNFNNINLDKKCEEGKILIKENYGTSKDTNIYCKNNNIELIIFLFKSSKNKNITIKNYYFIDSINVINVLYNRNIIEYQKYINIYKKLYLLNYENDKKKRLKDNKLFNIV